MVKALVLAAGEGKRIRPIAGTLPKPLLKIQGMPVMAHNLKLCASHGIKEVWVNLHTQSELIRKEIGDGRQWGVSVSYSYERELLGTAGAVKKLEKEFSAQPFIVLYGDNYTNCNLTALIKTHRASAAIGTVVVFDPEQTSHSGIAGGRVVLGPDGMIKNFAEGGQAVFSKSNAVNAGIYAFEPELLQYLPDGFSDFGKDIFPQLLKKGANLMAYKMEGFCLGLDTPHAYENAQKIFSAEFLQANKK